jgi:RNA polymerase sigma-70 factor (ECF subfamily)
VRAMEKRQQLQEDSTLLPWLRRILHNVAMDNARKHSHEVLVSDVEEKWRDDAYTIDASAVLDKAQLRDELEEALVRLPFAYRAVVVLHDEVGWTAQEIADQLGIGLPAAKQRLRRGRMMLTTALARGDERRQALAGVPLSCWEARGKVSDYLDDELPDADRRTVEGHLATCPTCPPLYAVLVGVRDTLGKLRDPDRVIDPKGRSENQGQNLDLTGSAAPVPSRKRAEAGRAFITNERLAAPVQTSLETVETVEGPVAIHACTVELMPTAPLGEPSIVGFHRTTSPSPLPRALSRFNVFDDGRRIGRTASF